MLKLVDEHHNNHTVSSVDDLLTIDDKEKKLPSVDSLLPIDEDKEVLKEENESLDSDVDDESNGEDPAAVQTKHDFVTSPWSRMGIIGGAFGAGFLLLFLMLNGIMNGGGSKSAKTLEVTPTPTPTAASDKQEGDVYAKLALAKQQEELDALNGKEKREGIEEDEAKKDEKDAKSQKDEDKDDKKERPVRQRRVRERVVAQETPPPRRRVNREASESEPVRPRRREVAQQPIPPIRPAAAAPKLPRNNNSGNSLLATAVSNNQSQAVAKDPLAELERLRSMGNVGRVEYAFGFAAAPWAIASTTTEATPKIEETADDSTTRPRRRRNRRSENVETATNTPKEIEELRPRWEPVINDNSSNIDNGEDSLTVPVAHNLLQEETQSPGEVAVTKENTLEDGDASSKENNKSETVAYGYLAEEALILEERKPQYLVVGSFASATLVTPLLLPQGNNNNRSPEQTNTLRFVAQLEEPLYSNTGEIAIPAGTQVTVSMLSVDGSSGVRAEVTAILKDGTEYPISPGTISVLGEAGSPLIAKPYDDKGPEIAKYDTTIGALAGLAKVGEIMNKPDEEVTEDLPLGGTRTRSRNNNRNMTGAFIEGFFGRLSETVGKRTEQATKEITSRPNVWYIPKNTRITIQVNRSIKL